MPAKSSLKQRKKAAPAKKLASPGKPISTQMPEAEDLRVTAFGNYHYAASPLQRTAAPKTSAQQQQQAKPNNTGLPNNLKSGIENLSGMSLDNVKVHYNSPQPAKLNALAYAQGTDIHVAPGQERHLPHEAWHVVQQAQGRVRPTMQMKGGVRINDNQGLEHEANYFGEIALNVGADSQNEDDLVKLSLSTNSDQPIQGKLIVGATDYTAAYNLDPTTLDTSTDTLMGELDTAVNGTDIEVAFAANRVAIKNQLKKWIEDNKGDTTSPKSHPIFGRKEQYRIYDTKLNLARGLLGWVNSKPGRREEKQFANRVNTNISIAINIDNLFKKIALKIDNLITSHPLQVDVARLTHIKAELSTDTPRMPPATATYLGHYQHELDNHPKGARVKTGIKKNQLAVVSNPLLFSLRDKVVVLHDLMEYFGTRPGWVAPNYGAGLLPEPTADKSRSTSAIDAVTGGRTASTFSRGKMDNLAPLPGLARSHGTRDETEAGTLVARSENAPIWAGQSFTAMRMINLADWVNANVAEKTALAWAIFAFWRKDYDHTSEYAYHTLHEVMDIASNFGVAYNIRQRGEGLSAHRLSLAATGLTADQEADSLNSYVDELRNYFNDRYDAYKSNIKGWFSGIYDPLTDVESETIELVSAAVRRNVAAFKHHIAQAKAGVNADVNLTAAADLATQIKTRILQMNQILTTKNVPA